MSEKLALFAGAALLVLCAMTVTLAWTERAAEPRYGEIVQRGYTPADSWQAERFYFVIEGGHVVYVPESHWDCYLVGDEWEGFR